jgi:hypothetical protein
VGLPVIDSNGFPRLLDENRQEEWEQFIHEHTLRQHRDYRSGHSTTAGLDLDEYAPFVHLCCHAAVAMVYMAPATVYQQLVQDDQGAHFLLPRFEFAVEAQTLGREDLLQQLRGLLAWMASGGAMLDGSHTQEAFDTGREAGLPILVPDVIVSAHETVTFARSVLGEEVTDALKDLIAQLRRSKE